VAIAADTAGQEQALLDRLSVPDPSELSEEAARWILRIGFAPDDQGRMRVLLRKAQAGRLTRREQIEIDGYERVGHLLDLVHSLARRRLRQVRR
jgi:hypothetical protein